MTRDDLDAGVGAWLRSPLPPLWRAQGVWCWRLGSASGDDVRRVEILRHSVGLRPGLGEGLVSGGEPAVRVEARACERCYPWGQWGVGQG